MKFDVRDMTARQLLKIVMTRFPETDEFGVETLISFKRISANINDEFDYILDKFGISQGKFKVLTILYVNPGEDLVPSEIANLAGVTRGTVTGLIDGLERDGLIKRITHSSDRRMVFVQLTAAGEHLLKEIIPLYFGNTSELIADFTKEEEETLRVLLQKIMDGLDRIKKR